MRTASLTNVILLPVILAPGLALATNGYFSHGFGVKSQGMAGTGIALPEDGLAAAINPAGTAFVGNRVDLGLTLVRPQRSAEIVGNAAGMNGNYEGNDSQNFLVPEIGYVEQISPRLAAGIAVYGNGGLNTDYNNNPFRAVGGTGPAAVNLQQLFVTPSLAWKFNNNHALGLVSILPTSVSRPAASARSQRPPHHPETSPTGESNPPPAGASVSAIPAN